MSSNILNLVEANGSRLSGIVTSLDYPNWPSHAYTARMVRQYTDSPFFVIPRQALNVRRGTVDSNMVSNFHQSLGLEGVNRILREGNIIPSVIVRYTRRLGELNPQTMVVNHSGFRVLESQLWNSLIALNGFDQVYQRLTGNTLDISLHQQTTIPSLIARIIEGKLEIATEMERNSRIRWVSVNEVLGQLRSLQDVIATTEKQNKLAWFVKSFATSGAKGVRLTKGGRLDQAEKNITYTVRTQNLTEGAFLVQPRVLSTINLGEEQRLKINLYLSGDNLDFVGIDAITTPIRQVTSHGGPNTKLALIQL